METNNLNKKSLIDGNLIVGRVAAGKTTALADEVHRQLNQNPKWKLIAVAPEHFFEMLRSDVSSDPRHELYKMARFGKDNQISPSQFYERTTLPIQLEETGIIIAVDEAAIFFESDDLRRIFARYILSISVVNFMPVKLLMTTNSLDMVAQLFGREFAENFSHYTLLQTNKSEPLFLMSNVDSQKIPLGKMELLMRDLRFTEDRPVFRRMSSQRKFNPGVPKNSGHNPFVSKIRSFLRLD